MKIKKQPQYGHDGKTNEEQIKEHQENFLVSKQPPIFNPFQGNQFHRTGLFMLDGLARASIAVLAIFALFSCGILIYEHIVPPKTAYTGYNYTCVESIYYASETIGVGTVAEITNPANNKNSPYYNITIALEENGFLKGDQPSDNNKAILNLNILKNENYLKKGKRYLVFGIGPSLSANRKINLITPHQGAFEIKKNNIVKNKYSKQLGIAGKNVTDIIEEIRSFSKPTNTTPQVSSISSSSESSSAESPTVKKEMPLYPVFENTDWGMSPDEVLTALGLTKSDWEETKVEEDDGTRLNYFWKNADIYGTKAQVMFVFSTEPKRNIGLIKVNVACVNDESIKAIKAKLDEKYGKTEGPYNLWKTGSIASDHPKWDLIVKAMIRETEETNAKNPNGGQLSTEGLSETYGKEPLSIISYMPFDNKENKDGACGVFLFGGYSAAWANSFE